MPDYKAVFHSCFNQSLPREAKFWLLSIDPLTTDIFPKTYKINAFMANDLAWNTTEVIECQLDALNDHQAFFRVVLTTYET